MSNPVWKNEVFKATARSAGTLPLRTKGVVYKTLSCLLILTVSTIYMWIRFYTGRGIILPTIIAVGGGLAGFYVSYAVPGISLLSVPLFTVLEGITVGGVSALVEIFYPGIILNAVTMTYIAALLVLLMYRFDFLIIGNVAFRSVSLTVVSIIFFYLLKGLLALFSIRFLYFISPVGMGVCLAVIIVGSVNLIRDMDFVKEMEEKGIRRLAEWSAVFGIILTVGWVYLEVAKIMKICKNFLMRQVKEKGGKLTKDKRDTSVAAGEDPASKETDPEK